MLLRLTVRSRKAITSLKLDQFVEEEICDKYVVELSLGDLPKVSCRWRRKPRPINDNVLITNISAVRSYCMHNYRLFVNIP